MPPPHPPNPLPPPARGLDRWLRAPLRRPRLVLAIAAVVTGAIGYHAPLVRVDGSIDRLLVAGDPERAYHEEIERVFGSDEVTRIGVFATDVFTPATLERIDRASRELRRIDGVRKVVSLATVHTVEATDDGLWTGPLMKRLPRTAPDAARFRERALASPLVAGRLVSAAGDATAIDVFYEPMGDEELARRGIEARVRETATRLLAPDEVAISGIPTLKAEGARRMEEDIRTFSVLALLLVVAVLAVTFRSLRGVAIPLVAVGAGVAWTNGLMALLDRPITIGSLVLNPLLMAIGVAYAIHVMSRYVLEARPERSALETVEATLDHVGLPVFLAALTTLLGFATLIPHPVPTIHDLGLWSVFGISVIALASLTVVPAILVLLPPPRIPARPERSERLGPALGALARQVVARPKTVLAIGLLACAPSLAGIGRLRVETDYLGFFDPQSTVRTDTDRIAAALSGAHPIQVVIEGDGPFALTRPESLAAIRGLQDFIDRQPGVDSTVSVLDYLSVAREAIEPGAGSRLPATGEEADQVLVLMDPREIEHVVTRDSSRGSVLLQTTLSSSAEVARFVERVERFAADTLPAPLRAHVTGTVILLNRTSDVIARQQIVGLAQMVAVLFVVMAVVFRSLRLGALSLLPNAIPIVLLFGLMGWAGISVNVATSMIAVIAIGIAVDDTIHYLTGLAAESRQGRGTIEAACRTMRAVGRPIVLTSVALAAGFLVSTASGFQPVRHFGALSAATMAFALFADLLVTPAIAALAGVTAAARREAPEAAGEDDARLRRTGGSYG